MAITAGVPLKNSRKNFGKPLQNGKIELLHFINKSKIVEINLKIKANLPYVMYGLAFLIFAIFMITKPQASYAIAGGTFLFQAMFASGFLLWVWPSVKVVWTSFVGKTAIVVLNLGVLVFATILARWLVSESLGLPVQDFDLTVSALVFITYVPAWILVIAFLAVISSVPIFLCGLFFGKSINKNNDFFKMMFHGLGAFGLVFCFATMFDGFTKHNADFKSIVKWIAMACDYHRAPAYPGIGKDDRIRIHENGVISYATIVNKEIVIDVREQSK